MSFEIPSNTLTWFVLNNEVHQYRKGPKFSVLISGVYLLKRGLLKRFYYLLSVIFDRIQHYYVTSNITSNSNNVTSFSFLLYCFSSKEKGASSEIA
jgi:hypothetical protein